jgi:hypothetical protein
VAIDQGRRPLAVVGGIRLAVDMTASWQDRRRYAQFGLTKDCRLFLSDAAFPIMPAESTTYPLDPVPRFDMGRTGHWLGPRRPAQRDCHIGCDIYGPLGTDLVAIEDAVVESVRVVKSYDDMIVVTLRSKHFTYRYLHLNEAHVEPGQEVKKGQVVGLIGQTGFCAYPHLHLQMAPVGTSSQVNPTPYVRELYDRRPTRKVVAFARVELSARDHRGRSASDAHFSVEQADGTVHDIGARRSTAIACDGKRCTVRAEDTKRGLTGSRTLRAAWSHQRADVRMRLNRDGR